MTVLAVLGLEFCCLAAGFLLTSYRNITRRGRVGLAIIALASTAAVVWMSTVGPISHGGVVRSPGEALLAMVPLLVAPIFPLFLTLLFRVKMAPVTGRIAGDGKQLRQGGISLLESVLVAWLLAWLLAGVVGQSTFNKPTITDDLLLYVRHVILACCVMAAAFVCSRRLQSVLVSVPSSSNRATANANSRAHRRRLFEIVQLNLVGVFLLIASLFYIHALRSNSWQAPVLDQFLPIAFLATAILLLTARIIAWRVAAQARRLCDVLVQPQHTDRDDFDRDLERLTSTYGEGLRDRVRQHIRRYQELNDELQQQVAGQGQQLDAAALQMAGSTARYDLLFETAPDAIVLFDHNEHVIAANGVARQWWQGVLGQLIGCAHPGTLCDRPRNRKRYRPSKRPKKQTRQQV